CADPCRDLPPTARSLRHIKWRRRDLTVRKWRCSMSSQDLRARFEAFLAAWNRRDYDELAAALSPTVVLVDHYRGTTIEGRDGFINRFKPTMDAFPDMKGETVSLLTEGNQFAQEI